ncbi:hypothetical protein ACIRT4_06690 [Pseudomonas aeruginosa]|uniref:hypothetical protein n=1 Tax=Pseudomonas aeruginosa TaxID=287 RepID=UPI003D9BCFF8
MSNISSKTVSNTKAQPSTEVSVKIIGGKPTTTSLDVAKHFPEAAQGCTQEHCEFRST